MEEDGQTGLEMDEMDSWVDKGLQIKGKNSERSQSLSLLSGATYMVHKPRKAY